MGIHHWVSTVILVILTIGFINRHQKKLHMIMMSSAFAIDLGLVLSIELQRHAIETFISEPPTPLLSVHVLFSTLVLIFYTVLAVLGVKLAKGQETVRPIHKWLGLCFIFVRLGNYVTSFWV